MKSATVPIDSIYIGDRARSDERLADDIVESAKGIIGQIQSIAVCEYSDECGTIPKTYELLAGFRRLKAFKEAGLTEVLVRIYPSNLSNSDRKSIELIENCARLDLTWQDQVRLIKEIHELQKEIKGPGDPSDSRTKSWTMSDTAKLIGRGRTRIVEDLEFAESLEKIPLLKKCKTRHEARKVLGKVKETIIVEELASREVERVESGEVGDKQKALIDSYLVGDFFDLIKEIDDETFDLVEADPPYGIGYNTSSISSQQDRDIVVRELEMEKFHGVKKENYPEFIERLISECARVMKKNSWMVLWFSTAHEWDLEIEEAADDNNLVLCPIPAVWSKGISRNSAPDRRLSSAYEAFYYLRKGEAQIIRPGEGNFFFYPKGSYVNRIHPTEKPLSLMRRILQTFAMPGSMVLVPFAGSGNTLVEAQWLKMQAIGFDKSQEYKDLFTLRVMEGDKE